MGEWITKSRKTFLNALSFDILNLFDFEQEIDPELIAIDNGISVYYDHYGTEKDGADFEGLQIYDGENFHTHINLDLVRDKYTSKSRFAFAHELGHFFIDEHHKELKNGYHPSKFDPKEVDQIELEANYFAGALLMPYDKYKAVCYRETFSLDLISKISDHFGVSRLMALLRFIEVGSSSIMIAFCQNGILKWFTRLDDFPYKVFKTKVGKAVPPTSVVGEYFRLGDYAKHTGVETIDVDDWFHHNGIGTLNEQCFFSEYGYIISLIWPR